jgi:nucleoside-diphosphate-sugar epimerase
VTAREFLDNGYNVRGLDLMPVNSELREAGLEMVYADITDCLSMLRIVEGCDAIIHCAAYATPHGKTAAETMRVNVIGTQNILDAAVAHGVKTTVITSSIGALGFSFPKHPCLPDYFPVDAVHPRRPQDPYGLSKVMNEESAVAATRAYGITTVVIRPPWVGDLARMVDNPWIYHRIEYLTDHRSDDLWAYVDVHDLAAAYRLAIEKELTGNSTFFIMADDVFAKANAGDLIERFFPERSEDVDKLTSNSLYDLKPAKDVLGFTAKLFWRDILAK